MAALVLSRAGKKVLVLEKDRFPRAKVCGYTLNPRIWSVWERRGLTEGFQGLPCFDVEGFTLEHEGVPIIRHRFRGNPARTVDRAALDAWLAEEAQASGAEYQFGVAVQGLTPTHVQTSRGEFAANVVIGADGRNSIIGRLSGLALRSSPCNRVGWQAHIEAPTLDNNVHMNVFPEGYYGINRIDSRRINTSIVLRADAKVTPDQILARYFPGISPASWKSVSPISRRAWNVTDGRYWLIGDSARVLEPLTGEGIYSALVTGEMAARNILSIERIGAEAAARQYRREHRRFYGMRTLLNSFVHWSLVDYRRGKPIMKGLKLWPAVAAQMIDWVQSPENPRLQWE